MTKAAILCVDDEDIPRTLRQLVLQKQGYEVVAVSSGKEALATLATQYHVSVDSLRKWNHLASNRIRVGDSILVRPGY